MTLTPLLAHQGGWDEILLVATPVVLLALLLWRANKKAARLERQREVDAVEPDDR
ncbi:MAG: hypothetical protein ACRD0A_09160 [Acidimicrobiales bacterium]